SSSPSDVDGVLTNGGRGWVACCGQNCSARLRASRKLATKRSAPTHDGAQSLGRTSRGLWRRPKTWRCFAERVGNTAAESKQDASRQHRGKRATPPDGVWRGLQEKATNRRAEGPGDGE